MTTSYNVEWKTKIVDSFEPKVIELTRNKTNDHPLKTTVVTERIPRRILGSQPSTGRTTPVTTPSSILEPLSMALEGVDPLTAFAIEEMDPLSKLAAEEVKNQDSRVSPQDKKINNRKPETEPWSAKKAAILSKFTTSEKISIVTSFLSEGEKVVVKAQSTTVDKIQHRLEQLDYIDEGSQTKLDLSQNEYMGRIEQLNRELVSAWNTEQRVKALKIAIQCAKLLADTSVLRFYPSKFVLITDILDVFGQLVYNRLRTKSDSCKTGSKMSVLPENFTPDMVSDAAKETCLNWFYKIASIRELVPRIYVEMALLKSYYFLSLSECDEAVERLTHMISGIGNPLVAVYARCYLCRIGLSVSHVINKQYLLQNFYGFLNSYHHLFSRSVKAELSVQKMTLSAYMTLFTPALDYMLQSVASDYSDGLLNDLLDKCRIQGNSSLILNTIMSAFKPAYISNRALQFLEMIEQCLDQGILLHSLLRTLGLCASVASPPLEHRRHILNIVWRHISSIKITQEYIECVEPWVVYVVKYFSYREINTILGDLIAHILPDRSYEHYYTQLKHIVENIVSNVQDIEALVVMDNFLPLVDLFQQESIKVEICKKILTGNINDHHINDPVVVNALMFLCTTLHDSVNALTPEDEYRQIGDILCQVINNIDYGRDFEQQLTFYVEARGMFSNIDSVFVQLVQCVNALSVNTRQIVKGLHTRKTSDFVRACAAYSFITIPSIRSAKYRLKLYLLSGQIALFNQCLGQADACFKAALTTISEFQNERKQISEAELVSYIKQFLSLLLVVPDNPDCSVLNVTRSLLNALQGYSWETNTSLISIYLSVLDVSSLMAQEWYPYHVDKLESNDSLYGSDPKFISEIDKISSVVTGEILTQLQTLDTRKKQAYFSLELFMRIALRSNLNPQLTTLAINLWNLTTRDGLVERNYLVRSKDYLKMRSFSTNNNKLQELVEKLDQNM